MIRIFAVAVVALGFAAAPAAAQTIIPLNTLDLSDATLDNNGVINFNAYGGTATAKTLPLFLTLGENYTLEITGSDGPGNRVFSAVYSRQGASILNFGDGRTLSSLKMTAEADGQLTLTYNGKGSFKPASISSIVAFAAPGPIAGAGLPALLGIAGIWFVRRRRGSHLSA